MLSKLSKVTQPINDKPEMKTWSVKPMFFALCHSHCWAQWNTMMEHMLAKFYHWSVLSVFTPEVRKAICLKDNLPFIYFPRWWDEREAAMVLPTRLKVPGVLLLGKSHLPDVWIKVSGWVYPGHLCQTSFEMNHSPQCKSSNYKAFKRTQRRVAPRPQPGNRPRFLREDTEGNLNRQRSSITFNPN